MRNTRCTTAMAVPITLNRGSSGNTFTGRLPKASRLRLHWNRDAKWCGLRRKSSKKADLSRSKNSNPNSCRRRENTHSSGTPPHAGRAMTEGRMLSGGREKVSAGEKSFPHPDPPEDRQLMTCRIIPAISLHRSLLRMHPPLPETGRKRRVKFRQIIRTGVFSAVFSQFPSIDKTGKPC